MWTQGKYHDKTALITRGDEITYARLYTRVGECFDAMRSLEEGIVVLTESATPEFIVTLLALLAARKPVAIASSAWTAFERESRLTLLGKCMELHMDGSVSRAPGPTRVDPATRLILFTTGSTGVPKAVQLSEENIRSNTRAVVAALDFEQARIQTLFLPLCYSYGLLGQLLPALEVGMTTNFPGSLLELKDRFAEENVEGMISGVPSHFEAILRMLPHDFVYEKITHIVTAGAFSPPDLRIRLHRAFPSATVYNNYGQTEASPRILCFNSSHPLFYTPATGYAVSDLQVKTSPDGELLVKGAQIMLGYLGDEDGTRAKVQDGWLRTGDAAEIADDGLVTVLGRSDDLFNVAGERTSRFEIESAIRRIPGVAGTAVLVIDDALYGIRVVAFIQPSDNSLALDRIRAELPRFLSGSKIPKELYLIPSIPMTSNGKLDRSALREIHHKLSC